MNLCDILILDWQRQDNSGLVLALFILTITFSLISASVVIDKTNALSMDCAERTLHSLHAHTASENIPLVTVLIAHKISQLWSSKMRTLSQVSVL